MDSLLHQEKRTKISNDNAIPEFKQALSVAQNIDTVQDATKQMSDIIENQVQHSLGDANYDRVIEMLGVMRDELIDFEEPKFFNDSIRQLKEKTLQGKLGGDRSEFWWFVRKHKIGLIDVTMSDRSDVTVEEGRKVCMHSFILNRGFSFLMLKLTSLFFF